MPGTLTGHTYLQRARLNGGHCLGENATLKPLIRAEQSPEGMECINAWSKRGMKPGDEKGRLCERDSHLLLQEFK